MSKDLSPLERDILQWIVARAKSHSLKEQVARAKVAARQHTGSGAYVDLWVPPDSPEVPAIELSGNPLDGPTIESPALEAGAGSLLFVKDGRLSLIEIFSYGSSFPESLDQYELEAS
jgi:hypothetical protein